MKSIRDSTRQPDKVVSRNCGFLDALRSVKDMAKSKKNIYVLSVCGPIPAHLIAVYVETLQQQAQQGQQETNIYGLSGFVMNEMRDVSLDIEFKALIGGSGYDSERRCKVAVSRTHMSVVQWLERYGTMLIPLSIIDADLFSSPAAAAAAVGLEEFYLCNYAAGKGVKCLQLCSLELNIVMMYRQGYVSNQLGTTDPNKKEREVNAAIAKYQEAGNFHLWKKQIPEYLIPPI